MALKHVVPVANMAGSAGKTTTAVTLAALLAEKGRHVLLIDLDPQANATRWLGQDPDEVEVGSAAVLLKTATVAEAMVTTVVDGLWLVPAARTSMYADVTALESLRAGRDMRLKLALRDCPEHIDTVLLDCPGSMGVMTIVALVAATTVITVTAPSSKELEGIPVLEDIIEEISETYDRELSLGAIVPCIVPAASAGRSPQEAMKVLREAYGELVTPTARRTIRAPDAFSHNIPLPVFAPKEGVTEDYRAILTYLEQAGVL